MDQVYAALDATWRILLVGLVLGAGLPTLFAVGLRSLAWSVGGEAGRREEGVAPAPHPIGRALAYLIFIGSQSPLPDAAGANPWMIGWRICQSFEYFI